MEKGQLEHELRGAIRWHQMSPRTEDTYGQWYRRWMNRKLTPAHPIAGASAHHGQALQGPHPSCRKRHGKRNLKR